MSDPDNLERDRLRLGSYVVGGAILAAVVCLLIVIMAGGGTTVTDKVALIGSITTFLGLVVGVFFGVNSSGSAHARNTASEIETSQAAATVADAAKSVSETARSLSATASRSMDASHALLQRRVAASRSPTEDTPTDADEVESLAGDPGEIPTNLIIPSARSLAVDTFARSAIHIANPASAQALFAQQVLSVAATEADANISRTSNQPRVTEYLSLLGFPYADSHGVPTRYCAAGVTWAVCKAYCDANGITYSDATRLSMLRSVLGDIGKYYFKPSAGCQVIMDDARARNTFVAKSQPPKPGYLVFYNWSGHDNAEHIGIVDQPGSNTIKTIEFNTTADDGPNQGNGGAVSRKERPMRFVLGYAKTYS
jgi:hypothetical protein